MENASKALIIAGAILISILIIAIGMYIYSSSTGSIENAISAMDTQEVQAFNATWTNYEGVQTGTQVKAMINQLIGHANTYQDEPAKVVAVNGASTDLNSNIAYIEDISDSSGASVQTDITAYITQLNTMYSNIRAKKNYTISFGFAGTPIIRQITIADV